MGASRFCNLGALAVQTSVEQTMQTVESEKREIEEMMRREGLKLYYRAVVRPIKVVPVTDKNIDIKRMQKELLESFLKYRHEYKCFDDKDFLKRLLRRNPSYRIALRLTGKRIDDEAENEIDVGEPLMICEPKDVLFTRIKLIQFMFVLESTTYMFGKHEKFREFVSWFQNELNNFLRQVAKYRTEFKIDVLDDYPTLQIEVKVWE